MNNSKIAIDSVEEEVEIIDETYDDRISFLEKQRGEMVQIVEAIAGIESSKDWKKLKKLVFDGVVANLERQLAHEAAKAEINDTEIYRLQGQLAWARKYADLGKLAQFFKDQIQNINNQIKYEQETPRDGAL